MPEITEIPFLFRAHPALAGALDHAPLVERPTPVERMRGLERVSGASCELYIKRDDLSARAYGGNKVRKLEFLLGAARAAGASEVLTFGAAGSNHALATAIHSRSLGLRSISMLVAQVNGQHVRRNLLASLRAGAEMHHYPDEGSLARAVHYQLARHERETGTLPYVIAGGGSAPLGVVGLVDAAFELRAQIDAGLLPEPARIYVALGTTGTAAGLRLGLDAAAISSRLVAVRVVHPDIGNHARLARLYAQTAALLAAGDPGFPPLALDAATIELRHEHYGERYALYTPEGLAAVELARHSDAIELEGTYTAKAFAALLQDLRERVCKGPILYWHTYSSAVPPGSDDVDYSGLPRAFHAYFEEDVQPLERTRDAQQ